MWKKEKLLITTNSPLPIMFSKDLYCKHVKAKACLEPVKRENIFCIVSTYLHSMLVRFSAPYSSIWSSRCPSLDINSASFHMAELTMVCPQDKSAPIHSNRPPTGFAAQTIVYIQRCTEL